MLLWKSHSGWQGDLYPGVSILVLLDVALKEHPPNRSGSLHCRFNPCSLGCCSESMMPISWHFRSRVSILVLLDVALKVPLRAGGQPQERVSILVLLDVALKGCRGRAGALLNLVSILVLLDVALKARVLRPCRAPTSSFNPCSLGCCSESIDAAVFHFELDGFNPCSLGCCSESLSPWVDHASPDCFNPCSLGCCSESEMRSPNSPNPPKVSILVLLDVALKVVWATDIGLTLLKFQSLFSWMLLWKIYTAFENNKPLLLFQSLFSWMLLWKYICFCVLTSRYGVSILVLLDVALKEHTVPAIRGKFSRFQSLFSWMLLWKYTESGNPIVDLFSFNPCSLGCCSERVLHLFLGDLSAKFQSLFSWMLLWKPCRVWMADDRYNVSILVLLDVALKAERSGLLKRFDY